MKKIISLIIITCIVCCSYAQTKNVFNYQVQANGNDGKPIINTAIKSKANLSNNGSIVYSEVRNVITNQLGLFTIPFGDISVVSSSGNFNSIDWSTGTKAIQIEIDVTGIGNSYKTISNNDLQSVPFALYAINGKVGPQGAVGPQGVQGIQGVQGTVGNTGPQGLPGTIGAVGATGNVGIQGALGTQGVQGVVGNVGIAGIQGIQGANGKNSLAKTSTENAGANCANGGQKIEYGLDANNNGLLEAAEINVALTKYVCKGNDVVATNVWSLTGNANTNATDFIGNTNQPLNLKMNNAPIASTGVFNNLIVGNTPVTNPSKVKAVVKNGLSVEKGQINIIHNTPDFEYLGIAHNNITTSGYSLHLNPNNAPVTINNGATLEPNTLTVGRGNSIEGTAKFIGTNNNSHINYSATEDTYIRGGKPASNVYINTPNKGNVNFTNSNGFIRLDGESLIDSGIYAKNYYTADPTTADNNINIVPISIIRGKTKMTYNANAIPSMVPSIDYLEELYGNILSTVNPPIIGYFQINATGNNGTSNYASFNLFLDFNGIDPSYSEVFGDGSFGFYRDGKKVDGTNFEIDKTGIIAQIIIPRTQGQDLNQNMFIEFTVMIYGIKKTANL